MSDEIQATFYWNMVQWFNPDKKQFHQNPIYVINKMLVLDEVSLGWNK